MTKQTFVAFFALLVAVAGPLAAKKNVLDVELSFVPQQSVGTSEVTISEAMIKNAIKLMVRDARPGDDPSDIGKRTDDDDRRHTLRATGDVEAFVAEALADIAAEWGVQVKDSSNLVLDVALIGFKATEANQAVGATYEADARFSGTLTRGGEEIWSGSATGDATRYGKKFSNENVNEVLSDALIEGFSSLLSSSDLHRAWSGR